MEVPTSVTPVSTGTTVNAHEVGPPVVMHMSAPTSSQMGSGAGAHTLKRSMALSPNLDPPGGPLKCPRYRRGLIWSPTDSSFSPTARSSEYADPVPEPPQNLANDLAAQTVAEHPDLFQIVTPINVRRLEELLDGHPNPAFVLSVCHALRTGFWPWADTSDPTYPSINDNSMQTCIKTDAQRRFIHEQLDEEIRYKGSRTPSAVTYFQACIACLCTPFPNPILINCGLLWTILLVTFLSIP